MNMTIAFGSRVRGDSDLYSDTDLLIISDEACVDQVDPNGTLHMERQRVLSASRAGSLFFRHVFDEGRLLVGQPTEYAILCSSWRSAVNYQAEIEENRDILSLLSFVPANEAGRVAAVDIIICALRSILIRTFAEQGEYLFSWSGLTSRSVDLSFIQPAAILLISKARKIKNLYRTGILSSVTPDFLRDLVVATQPVLGSMDLRIGGREIPRNLPDHCSMWSYKQLRAIELVRAAYPDDPMAPEWSRWISNPRGFCVNSGY